MPESPRMAVCSCGHPTFVEAADLAAIGGVAIVRCPMCDPHRQPIAADRHDPVARAMNAACGIDPDQAPRVVVD